MQQDTESRNECQHLTAPPVYQILHIMMVMRCCNVLEENDTMLQQFWLFMANSWPHLILQVCAVILDVDYHTSWHGTVKNKSISAEEHDVHNFQSTLKALCNFLLW
jgi:hypothetical protein